MKQRFLPAAVRLIPVAALAFVLNSCGDDTTTDTVDSATEDSTAVVNNDTNTFDPGVPSPSEIFAFMKAAGASNANFNLINPVENEKKYESKKAQSLNLGIYSADLLYCSTFGAGSNKIVPAFGVCVRMGDKLNVATNLSEKDKERISNNAGNADSLVAISNDLYLSSFENLYNGDRGADLSLMLAGGWVETLYLTSNMVKDYEKDKMTVERIGDQKASLENLIEFMSKYESNADVKSVSDQLKELKAVMDEAQTSAGTSGGMTVKNGKRVLGGGAKTTMTKEQFEKVKAKVTEIRTGFVNAQ